jgi:hypothetical protein
MVASLGSLEANTAWEGLGGTRCCCDDQTYRRIVCTRLQLHGHDAWKSMTGWEREQAIFGIVCDFAFPSLPALRRLSGFHQCLLPFVWDFRIC